MKKNTSISITYMLTLAIATMLIGCGSNTSNNSSLQAKVDSLQNELKKFTDEKALTDMRMKRMDSLDFDVYSNQKWDKLSVSHADNIRAIYPDGTVTVGLYPQHVDMLKPMFVFAPDTKVTSHPVNFGSGDWTAMIGEVEGTFSHPMPMGGMAIPPTGKKFKFMMATIGHWQDGKMIEEYLFWDNQSFLKQIGLAK